MNCPYCAEKIQDEAILCRFCGAVKQGESWAPPRKVEAHSKRKGRFTICSAGVLFILSGTFELYSITSEVPLFGALRGGAAATIYHLIFFAAFTTIGTGLLTGKRWGYISVFAGTIFYTLDRMLFILDGKAREAYLMNQMSAYREYMDLIDKESLDQLLIFVTLISMACWWGFALYIYMRREYFQSIK